MPTRREVEANTRRVRIALSLIVTSSALQCALVFGIYEFHLATTTGLLLALLSWLPIFTLVALSARVRASSPVLFPQSYLHGTVIFSITLVFGSTLVFALEVLFPPRSLSTAGLLAAFPLLAGVVPALLLLLPKRVMGDYSLGELLMPVRIKLATPAWRLAYRMTAFLFIFIACDFVVRIFFNNYVAKGTVAYAVALLPVLPIFGLIPIYRKYMVEEQDEFQRYLFIQSVLWALLGILIVGCAVEQLERNALISDRLNALFRPDSFVLLFYFLQLEAGFLIKAIHSARLKRDQ